MEQSEKTEEANPAIVDVVPPNPGVEPASAVPVASAPPVEEAESAPPASAEKSPEPEISKQPVATDQKDQVQPGPKHSYRNTSQALLVAICGAVASAIVVAVYIISNQ